MHGGLSESGLREPDTQQWSTQWLVGLQDGVHGVLDFTGGRPLSLVQFVSHSDMIGECILSLIYQLQSG